MKYFFIFFLVNCALQAEQLDDGRCRVHEFDRYRNNIGHYTRGSCDDALRLCNEKRNEESHCSRFPNGIGKFDYVGNKCRMWIVNKKYPNDLEIGRYAIEKNCKRAFYSCRNYTNNYEKCVCRYFEIDQNGKWVSLYSRDNCKDAKAKCKENKLPGHSCSQDNYDDNKKVAFKKRDKKCNFLIIKNTDNTSVKTVTESTCLKAKEKCEKLKGPVHHCEKENIDGCRYVWLNKNNYTIGYFKRKNCQKAKAACSSYINAYNGVRCIRF